METIVKKDLHSNDTQTILENYQDVVEKIDNLLQETYIEYVDDRPVVKKRYQLEGLDEKKFFKKLNSISGRDIKDLGIRKMKVFKRMIRKLHFKLNLDRVNRLLRFIKKHILTGGVWSGDFSAKITCEKHDLIQAKRKEWKKQQEIADRLLMEYKKEKSDFYK